MPIIARAPMLVKLPVLLAILVLLALVEAHDQSFIYNNGFNDPSYPHLTLDGIAEITSAGLLKLTNDTEQKMGHAFYPNPVTFKTSENDTAFSFSTNFIFAIRSQYANLGGHGIAFVIAPTRGLPGAVPSTYLGLFNVSNNMNLENHVFAVELDTIQNTEFDDINANHVGIDFNGLKAFNSSTAAYFDEGLKKNLSLISGKEIIVWIEYDASKKHIEVTIAPIGVATKPSTPLLSLQYDLSLVLHKTMLLQNKKTGFVFLREQ